MMCAVLRPRPEVFLLAFGLGLGLLVLEAGVRLTAARAPQATGYAPVNTNRRAMQPRNSAGYRDLERTTAKPPGVRRVLALGDSFTWGASVEFDDAWPQRLERSLSRRRREKWEVVNLALPGMNSVDQRAQLENEGFAYQPDVVVLAYVLNDSEDAQAAETRRAEDWIASRQASPSALDRSALLRMVRGRWQATLENRRRIAGYRSMYDEEAPGWRASKEALRAMGAACRARGVPFVVAIFPLFGNPLDDSYPFFAVHVKIRQAAEEAGARVVDLLDVYRGLRWDVLVVDGVDDEHPNEIAQRLAANRLLHALDDVLPAAPPAR